MTDDTIAARLRYIEAGVEAALEGLIVDSDGTTPVTDRRVKVVLDANGDVDDLVIERVPAPPLPVPTSHGADHS